MNRDDIIRMAREARLAEPYHPFNPWSASQEALERFAALVAAEVDKNWVQGKAKINVPTATMEQEFNNYHRLGYKAGAAAEREACERLAWDTPDDEEMGIRTAIALAIRERGEK